MTPSLACRTATAEAQLAAVLDLCEDGRTVRFAADLGATARPVLAHGAAVAALALALARRAGLSAARHPVLARAALLHDAGKRYVPRAVLDKSGRLLPHERQLVEAHAAVGASMLLEAGLAEEAQIVRHHHERWDGNGYPDRLMGDAIPFESRLILIADAFTAMTEDRPYRRALPVDLALAEIASSAGSQLDPDSARLLREVL